MFDIAKKNIALAFSIIAIVVSGCTSLGLDPLPNVYEDAETVAENTYVTIGAFEAAQETLIEQCQDQEPNTTEGDICVSLISFEQTLRPAVTASAQIAAEYVDINARIEAAGADAPAEWLALAADVAGRLSATYGPVKEDVDEFIERAGNLVP